MWLLVALGLAVAFRILLPILRARRDPLSKTLVFEFGIRPSGPGGLSTRRDRVMSGLLSLFTAGLCIGAAFLAERIEEHTQNMSNANYVATGFMFLLFFLALLALIRGLADLIRAPFTKAPTPGPGSAPPVPRNGREA
jgi:hypothetical protein